jgi:hypothetical protein
MREYTRSPVIEATSSLSPPALASLVLSTSTFQPARSAKREYMRKRSAAKRAASSPPVPLRISTIVFRASFGSEGRSSTSSFFSSSARSASSTGSSSSAISRSSGSARAARSSATW